MRSHCPVAVTRGHWWKPDIRSSHWLRSMLGAGDTRQESLSSDPVCAVSFLGFSEGGTKSKTLIPKILGLNPPPWGFSDLDLTWTRTVYKCYWHNWPLKLDVFIPSWKALLLSMSSRETPFSLPFRILKWLQKSKCKTTQGFCFPLRLNGEEKKNLINKIWHLAKVNCQLKGIKLKILFWGLLLCLKEHIKLQSVILNFMENT